MPELLRLSDLLGCSCLHIGYEHGRGAVRAVQLIEYFVGAALSHIVMLLQDALVTRRAKQLADNVRGALTVRMCCEH